MRSIPAFFIVQLWFSMAAATAAYSEINSLDDPEIFQNTINQTTNSLPQGVLKYGKESDLCKRVVETHGGMIENFVWYLKLFVHDTIFDAEIFGIFSEKIHTDLLKMEFLVGAITPCTEELSNQISFTKSLFFAMNDAFASMGFYRLSGDQGQRLVYKIIQLNIRLMVMHDAYGKPDTKIKNFENILTRITNILDSWVKIFAGLPEKSLSVRLMFEAQYQSAQNQLKKLKELVPK